MTQLFWLLAVVAANLLVAVHSFTRGPVVYATRSAGGAASAALAGLGAGLVRGQRSKQSRLQMAGFGPAKVSSVPTAAQIMASAAQKPCACGSGSLYAQCCMPYHAAESAPPTPTAAVRSRFSCLCLKLPPDYLIKSTHPAHKEFVDAEQKGKLKAWTKALVEFANEYDFQELVFDDEPRDGAALASAKSEGDVAFVSFKVKMAKAGVGERTSEFLTEVSEFHLTGGKWLYRDAKVNSPFKAPPVQELAPTRQKFITTAKRGVPKGN